MTNVADRQTIVISINLTTLLPSQSIVPLNLRFAADEIVLQSLMYSPAAGDVADAVQIWCDKTCDGLIGSFPNNTATNSKRNEHFRLTNTFQTGNITFQFQTTANGAPFFYNPQALISPNATPLVVGNTRGIVSFTLEFIKLIDKSLY